MINQRHEEKWDNIDFDTTTRPREKLDTTKNECKCKDKAQQEKRRTSDVNITTGVPGPLFL